LNNLSIKNKLFLVAIIPILSIIYLSYSVTHEQIIKIQKINNFKRSLDNSILINELISNLQVERGLSSAYTNKDKNIRIELTQQITKTNNILYTVTNKYNIKSVVIDKQKLAKFREDTLNHKNNVTSILDFYSNIINNLFLNISKLPTITNNNDLSLNALSLVYLTKAKEFAGLERAVGAYIFSKEEFSNESFIKIKALQNQYNSEITSFYSLSNTDIKNKYYQLIIKESDEVEKFKYMEDMLSQNIYKKNIISNIRLVAGYGGLIHNFKNYILRGKNKYKEEFNKNYKKLISYIKKYKKLNISPEEIKLLDDIEKTFQKYNNAINNTIITKDKLSNIKNIDNQVKIDDTPAIAALNILYNNIVGINPNSWFKYATIRINKIIQLEKIVFKQLKEKQENISNKLNNTLYTNIFLILFIIVFTLYYAYKILENILSKLEDLKLGLLEFFDYINGKSKTYHILHPKGDDEIDNLTKTLKNGIKDTSKYIKKEIKSASLKDQKLYESAKMAQMGEMIGNIAHQWRQPLSVISTIASSIQLKQEMGILNDETIDHNMNKIVQNTNYLSETIDIFSNFIKDEKIYKEIILQEEIKVAFTIIESNLINNQIKLISNIDKVNTIKINLISGELPQVIINIINNAKDILIEKQIKDSKIILELKEDLQNNKAIITIEDNAGGIPDKIIAKVFDPYFTTKHKSNGTGLGLHMSYKIINESLKGDLYVKNTDNGAKFFIELPL